MKFIYPLKLLYYTSTLDRRKLVKHYMPSAEEHFKLDNLFKMHFLLLKV